MDCHCGCRVAVLNFHQRFRPGDICFDLSIALWLLIMAHGLVVFDQRWSVDDDAQLC